jgi:hypothetical protein
VSICGVSAAISAAGAVQARREQLAYAASLVIVFALPSIFILTWLADMLNLSPAVTGAWIGGNIDTTAAVAAAGSIAGENVLALATIVKSTQNVLIGVVAIALTAYFTFKIERRPDARAPGAGEIWRRFLKFVLRFLAASVIATIYLSQVGSVGGPTGDRRRQRPADPALHRRVREYRAGVQGEGPQDRRLATGRRVRGRHSVQSRCRACDLQRAVRELQAQLID